MLLLSILLYFYLFIHYFYYIFLKSLCYRYNITFRQLLQRQLIIDYPHHH